VSFHLTVVSILTTFYACMTENKVLLFGALLISYYFVQLVWRSYTHGDAGFYSMFWICNVSVLLAGIALLRGDFLLVQSTICSVAFAHLSWCLDVGLHLAGRKMVIGTAYYVFDPKRTNIEIIATLHHVWFIPLCLVLVHNSQGKLFFWKPLFQSTIILFFCCGTWETNTQEH